MKWKYLSYPLNSDAFGYGDGKRFKIDFVRSMCCGDTSNNSEFSMPTHYGTHLDYPFHFSDSGAKSNQYQAQDFIFNRVSMVDLSEKDRIEDLIIKNEHLPLAEIDPKTDFLIIKTGFCHKRFTETYWKYGYGFHPETAAHIKSHLPLVKAIGFDLISLNSYQHRPLGREAHKAFLIEQDILIVEELDLRTVSAKDKINTLIVAPLLLDNADGAPCTIFTEIADEN